MLICFNILKYALFCGPPEKYTFWFEPMPKQENTSQNTHNHLYSDPH